MDSRAWDERYAAVDLVWGGAPNRWVAREVAEITPGRALDLAAGEGRNALWLAGRGWRVTAVDFSGVALDRGRRLAARAAADTAGRIRWVRADLLEYVPERAAYELVVVAYLHLPAAARRRVLRRAAAALAPGGELLVVGHDTANLTGGTGGPRDAEVLFTAEDVLADLAEPPGPSESPGPPGARLERVRAERVRRPVAQEAGPPKDAIDALVRLRRTP
ncbi:class I SAM-dependent methyltransferase [Streptomyces sp. MAR4 CNX-425]|uniref:class I SAM-dependent methyltransferase n=1 Tax=Streptomyces sp. MAR4 CNX-425 TaxID=3406343 RepID=UPI003B50E990